MIISAKEVLIDEVGAVLATAFVPDVHGQPEFKIQSADLTDVLILAAALADAGAFEDSLVALPLEDGEGTETDAAFLTEVLFEHADVGVFPVAAIAGHWEVR